MPRRSYFALPCGCRSCGCLCDVHAPAGVDLPCARHSAAIVARWIAGEAAALVALGLLIASIAVWSAVLPSIKKQQNCRFFPVDTAR